MEEKRMNIKLSGNGVGENKVVFEKLLTKWDELFTRTSLFDEMEFVETDNDGTITFTNDNAELSFYQTETSKAYRNDLFIPGSELAIGRGIISILHDRKGNVQKQLGEVKRHAVILMDVVYETYAQKRISFVFSKYTDSNEIILHIEFTDDESDCDLSALITATCADNTLASLEDVLKALSKDNMIEHLEFFKKQVVEHEARLKSIIQQKTEEERNEKLQPAFDALNSL